jgi:aspartyl-tRNA(Asn)/glutamyl-tRNA(Gln) amidotransferase subunit A
VAASVGCCAILGDIMAGGGGRVPEPVEPASLELAVLDHYVTEGMDANVARAWEQALALLAGARASMTPIRLPEIERLPELNARGGIAAAEAYTFHRTQLAARGHEYDPRVANRIAAGVAVDPTELERLRAVRRDMIGSFGMALTDFDAVLAPTVPITAPPLDAFAADEDYVRLNLLLLRNPSLFNFLDGCAISLPIHEPGHAPVGLMLAAPGGRDQRLLDCANAIETVLGQRR